jgi:DinB family protein
MSSESAAGSREPPRAIGAGVPASNELQAELREYDRQFEALERDARRLVDGLSERALVWHEAAGTWSIGDCLDHLSVTGKQSLSHIRSAIAEARSRGLLGAGPFRHPVTGRVLIRLMDAPPRMRFKAPRAYRPMRDAPVSEILTAFFLLQSELIHALSEANGVDLARVKVANPVSTWFRMTLGQEFALTAAHERRHLWQAWRVRRAFERSGPPGSRVDQPGIKNNGA